MIPLGDKQAKLADYACAMIPAATVFLATLTMVLPLPLPIGIFPNFAFLFVIIWASLQPGLMPVWLAFLLGLMFDLVAGLPLGHMTLLFTASVGAVRMAESYFEGHNSLMVDWVFTSVVLLVAAWLSWQLCAFVAQPTTLWPILAQAGVTILAYPLAVAIVAALQRKILLWAA